MSEYKHDVRLKDIKLWFESLPDYLAQMQVVSRDDGTLVEIEPLVNLDASRMWIRLNKDTGFANLGAGEGYLLDDTFWEEEIPFPDVCHAIISGNLTEEVCVWKNRVIAVRGWLVLSGEMNPIYNTQTYSIAGEIGWWLSRRKSRRVIHYPPY